jgi:hypothetical protein
MFNKQQSASQALFDEACRCWLQNLQSVTSPLGLISQIQRSGGSMLNQLFDGHPEVHAHPHELKFGYPRKYDWPPIDLTDPPERWFEIFFEDIVVRHFRYGYKKMEKYTETYLFNFLPSLQKEIFIKYLNSLQTVNLRDVFNAYMTSYFRAWVNNQNAAGQKKCITAFTPRLSIMPENMASFFDIYPDGRLISVIRDAKNWYPSASRHLVDRYRDIRLALSQWKDSAQSMVRNKHIYGDRVCIISFEDLIRRTDAVMRYLAEFLDIQFDDILLTPTFNKIPIKPNTSFKIENPGIMLSALERYKTLSPEEVETIDEMTGKVYNEVMELAVSIP